MVLQVRARRRLGISERDRGLVGGDPHRAITGGSWRRDEGVRTGDVEGLHDVTVAHDDTQLGAARDERGTVGEGGGEDG